MSRPARLPIAVLVTAIVVVVGVLSTGARPVDAAPATKAVNPPPVRHVFVVNLENKGYDETFGPGSPAPYLSRTLRGQGQLLSQYYGVAHNSLPNYLAQISGQGPNAQTQGDCQVYSDFVQAGTTPPDQAVGQGCVYPAGVRTLADQLDATGLTWRGYMEDMGTPCWHPAPNSPDDTQHAKVGDQYAARHNPFVYFKSITGSPSCAANVVDLSHLEADLGSVSTTRNLTYVTPNLCNDAHDAPCVDGRPGGLVSADEWLQTWMPKILASPAFRKDGLLVVTFDESDNEGPDSAAGCCGEGPGPNSPMPGIYGPGGGRTGTVLVSPFITPGTFNDAPYNHYSLLRYLEDTFGLAPLGYAQQARGFGQDVWGAR
ncbi:MAG: phosphoesterase [Nocardioidaceae bacterium]|nr:phosphoesterase [Nocardioidaceae bacterium]